MEKIISTYEAIFPFSWQAISYKPISQSRQECFHQVFAEDIDDIFRTEMILD